MSLQNKLKLLLKQKLLLSICLTFFLAYMTLAVGKHLSFQSGYDLSIIDQAVWKYAHFKNPITTTHVYYDTPIYIDHLEIILIIISPLYYIFDSAITLIVLQVVSVIASGIAVFLLARKYKIARTLAHALLVSYYAFFGIQFAIWADVHTLVFAVGFMSYFLYFLETKRNKLALLFLVLAIICKEDIALLTLLISSIFIIKEKQRTAIIAACVSLFYLLILFFIYFPTVLPEGYRFGNSSGLLSDVNPIYLIDSAEKQKTILYSLGWFGFIPLLYPIGVIPFIGDLAHYFVLGKGVIRTEDIFLHYRSTVGLLLIWPTIIAISKVKFLNNWKTALYLLLCAAFLQYYLHLPLSYLSKKWFWQERVEIANINHLLKKIPENASVATHNNIAVHLTHRDEIYGLFPMQRDFKSNSPCGTTSCGWFRVGGDPKFLFYDKGSNFNALHYLTGREEFFETISNLEKNGNIQLIEHKDTSYLYRIIKKI